MKELRTFKVATFYRHGEKLSQISCYTRVYNPQWEGCIIYDVEARSGAEAKKKAKLLRHSHETERDPMTADKVQKAAGSTWVITDENLDLLGQTADTADNYLAGTVLHLPAEFHVKCLKTGLEEISKRLKAIYRDVAGQDPWEDHSNDIEICCICNTPLTTIGCPSCDEADRRNYESAMF